LEIATRNVVFVNDGALSTHVKKAREGVHIRTHVDALTKRKNDLPNLERGKAIYDR